MATGWNDEEKDAASSARLDSLSGYQPSQDTARLKSLVERLEVHVVDKIGVASDGRP